MYYDSLTKREKEVLSLICIGLNDEEIANRLFISKTTAKTHLYAIYDKYYVNGCISRTKLVIKRFEELEKEKEENEKF